MLFLNFELRSLNSGKWHLLTDAQSKQTCMGTLFLKNGKSSNRHP